MTLMSPPSSLVRPRTPARPPARPPARDTKLERDSLLATLTLVLDDLARRYPSMSCTTIRSLAVDVLCHARPEQLTPSMVARVLEARLSALL